MKYSSYHPFVLLVRESLEKDPLSKKYGYKIYCMSDDNGPFYIGCTSSFVFSRISSHIGCAKSCKPTPLYEKLKIMLDKGLIPKVTIIDYYPETQKQSALIAEMQWIKKIETEGFRLLNKARR